MAGPRGFEPRSTVLETAILPLNYKPNKTYTITNKQKRHPRKTIFNLSSKNIKNGPKSAFYDYFFDSTNFSCFPVAGSNFIRVSLWFLLVNFFLLRNVWMIVGDEVPSAFFPVDLILMRRSCDIWRLSYWNSLKIQVLLLVDSHGHELVC